MHATIMATPSDMNRHTRIVENRHQPDTDVIQDSVHRQA